MTALPYSSAPRPGRNLTHGMLDTIGRAIVTGAYDATPFPTEAQLTEQHGVSRSVTREAVKMLTAKGLLSARARVGTVVQPPGSWNLFDTDVLRWLLERTFSVELLRQFSELRLAIEPEAAALAARHAQAHQLDQIRDRVRSVTGMNCVIELIPPRTLPRTSSGKLSRTKARNLYLSGDIKPYDIAA